MLFAIKILHNIFTIKVIIESYTNLNSIKDNFSIFRLKSFEDAKHYIKIFLFYISNFLQKNILPFLLTVLIMDHLITYLTDKVIHIYIVCIQYKRWKGTFHMSLTFSLTCVFTNVIPCLSQSSSIFSNSSSIPAHCAQSSGSEERFYYYRIFIANSR